MQLRHAPVVEVLTAAHRVGEVNLPVVAIVDVGQRRGYASFRHHRVCFAKERFANETNRHSGVRCFDCRAESRASGANHEHIMLVPLIFGHLEQPHVMPDAHRTQSDEKVGESHPDQAEPRPAHVPAIEAAHAVVGFLPHRCAGELVDITANEMSK